MKTDKIFKSLALLLLLMLMYTIATAAITGNMLSIGGFGIQTGYIKINLNNGERIFDENDLSLSPGESIKKTITVQNIGSGDAYYKLHMENVEGALSEVLQFALYRNGVVVATFKANDLTSSNPYFSSDVLRVNQTDLYEVEVSLPDDLSNRYNGSFIKFDMVAVAVQTKNNDGITFPLS